MTRQLLTLISLFAFATGCAPEHSTLVVEGSSAMMEAEADNEAMSEAGVDSAATETTSPASSSLIGAEFDEPVSPSPTVASSSPITSTPTSVVATTTRIPGAPLPSAPPGFCSALALRSKDLVSDMGPFLVDDVRLDGPTLQALIIASRDLLLWASTQVPVSLASEIGALVGVYDKVAIALHQLDSSSITGARLRGSLFTTVFESLSVGATDLEIAAVRFAAFVKNSCGPGYLLLANLGDVFATDTGDSQREVSLNKVIDPDAVQTGG